MKIVVDAIKFEDFTKLSGEKVPLIICAGKGDQKISEKTKKELEEKYVKFIDKAGRVLYVSGIITPELCEKVRCDELEIDGKTYEVTKYNLEKCKLETSKSETSKSLNGKYVVTAHLDNGQKVSIYKLIKHIRLKTWALNKSYSKSK